MSEFSRATSRRGRVADRRRSSPARQRADDELVLAGHAVHAGSAGDRMSPVALLSVQRTAGNAAAASIIQGRPHRSSRRLDPLVRRLEPERSDGTDASREHQSAAPVQRATGKRLGKKLAKPFRRLGSSAKGVGKGFRRNALWGRKRTEEDTYQSLMYGPAPKAITVSELQEAAKQVTRELKNPTGIQILGGSSPLPVEDLLKHMLIELHTYSPKSVPALRGGMKASSLVDEKDVIEEAKKEHQLRQASTQKKKEAERKKQDPMERIATAIELLAKDKAAAATGSTTKSNATAPTGPTTKSNATAATGPTTKSNATAATGPTTKGNATVDTGSAGKGRSPGTRKRSNEDTKQVLEMLPKATKGEMKADVSSRRRKSKEKEKEKATQEEATQDKAAEGKSEKGQPSQSLSDKELDDLIDMLRTT